MLVDDQVLATVMAAGAYIALFMLWLGLRRSKWSMRLRVIVTSIAGLLLINAAMWSDDRVMGLQVVILLGIFAAGVKMGGVGWRGVQQWILQCAECGYDLSGQGWEAKVCPECGAGAEGTRLRLQQQRLRRRWRLFGAGWALVALALTPMWLELSGVTLVPFMPTSYLLLREQDPTTDATDELVRRIESGQLSEKRLESLARRALKELEAAQAPEDAALRNRDYLWWSQGDWRAVARMEYWTRIGWAAMASGHLAADTRQRFVEEMAWVDVRRNGRTISVTMHLLVDRGVMDVTDETSAWACGRPLQIYTSGNGGAWMPMIERGFSMPNACEADAVRVTWRLQIALKNGDELMDWAFDDELDLGEGKSMIFEPK